MAKVQGQKVLNKEMMDREVVPPDVSEQKQNKSRVKFAKVERQERERLEQLKEEEEEVSWGNGEGADEETDLRTIPTPCPTTMNCV